MACHHHRSRPPTTNTTTATCCCNSCCGCNPPHLSPPLPDPLLQALAAHILQSTPPSHHDDPYSQSPKLNTHNLHPQNLYQHHQRRSQNPRFQETPETNSLLSSLLRRIDTLESSLLLFSPASSAPSPYSCPPYSLRDLAARVIQTHFRAFLVRRSRTLGQLKDLAVIKSTFNFLKSSLSSQTHVDFDAISHKAVGLLLQLDSILSGDPLIRDGKKSISRDILRFLEFVDGMVAKRYGLSFKTDKSATVGRPNGNKSGVLNTKSTSLSAQREMIEQLKARLERISGFSSISQNDEEDLELEGLQQVSDDDEENPPRAVIHGKNRQIRTGALVKRNGVQSRVKKSVTFAEDGNVYRVFGNTSEPVSSGDGNCSDENVSSDDQAMLVENLNTELEEVKGFPQGTQEDEEAHLETGASPQSSDGERNCGRILRSQGSYKIRGHVQGGNGDYVFSAPLPLKMESKAALMKNRKSL